MIISKGQVVKGESGRQLAEWLNLPVYQRRGLIRRLCWLFPHGIG
jgi:hypothetical protein